MKTEIKKAKITSQSTLEVTLIEFAENDVTNEVVKKCGNLVHEDMRLAFKALSGHMAMLCDLKESVDLDLNDDEHAAKVDKIFVNSFSVGGSDDSEGVCLIGGKKMASGKVLNLVAPFQKYEDDDYAYCSELQDDVTLCITEVEAYLFDNKCAVRQLDMFEELENEGGEETSEKSGMKVSFMTREDVENGREGTVVDMDKMAKNVRKFKEKITAEASGF